jgi:hypothetical protein
MKARRTPAFLLAHVSDVDEVRVPGYVPGRGHAHGRADRQMVPLAYSTRGTCTLAMSLSHLAVRLVTLRHTFGQYVSMVGTPPANTLPNIYPASVTHHVSPDRSVSSM